MKLNLKVKKMQSLLLVSFALLMIFASLSTGNSVDAVEVEINDVNVADLSNNDQDNLISAELALNHIQEADKAGADTTLLVARYNEALELLHNAQNAEFTSCATYEECKAQVDNTFVSISADAILLKDQTDRNLNVKLVISGISAVAGALVVSFLGLYIHKAWKNYQLKQFLAMEIREAEDRSL